MKIQAFTGLGHFITRATALLLVTLLLLAALPAVGASARPALSIISIGVGSQAGTLTYGTAGSATYAVTVTSDTDVPSSTLSVTGLPAGATGSFSPNPVSCAGVGCVATSTLTVSTTTAAFAVTAHSFTVDSTGTAITGSGSLTIGPRPITVTAAASSKPYDGGLTSSGVPTVTTGSLVNGNTGNFTQTYATKTVGTNKPLTPSGSVNDGNSGLNYTITFVPANTGTITAFGLTISGATAVSKQYDGLLTTTMDGSPTLVGVVSGDSVTLNTASAVGTFATEHVGTAKPVTASGYSLAAGGDSANSTLAQPTGLTANITARPITVTAV
ncbi:MAG: YDG domain-containing protein, partial [Anaerolineales bacterium]